MDGKGAGESLMSVPGKVLVRFLELEVDEFEVGAPVEGVKFGIRFDEDVEGDVRKGDILVETEVTECWSGAPDFLCDVVEFEVELTMERTQRLLEGKLRVSVLCFRGGSLFAEGRNLTTAIMKLLREDARAKLNEILEFVEETSKRFVKSDIIVCCDNVLADFWEASRILRLQNIRITNLPDSLISSSKGKALSAKLGIEDVEVDFELEPSDTLERKEEEEENETFQLVCRSSVLVFLREELTLPQTLCFSLQLLSPPLNGLMIEIPNKDGFINCVIADSSTSEEEENADRPFGFVAEAERIGLPPEKAEEQVSFDLEAHLGRRSPRGVISKSAIETLTENAEKCMDLLIKSLKEHSDGDIDPPEFLFKLNTNGSYETLHSLFREGMSRFVQQELLPKVQNNKIDDEKLHSIIYEESMDNVWRVLNQKIDAALRGKASIDPTKQDKATVLSRLETSLNHLLARAIDLELDNRMDEAEELLQMRIGEAEKAAIQTVDFLISPSPTVWYDCADFYLRRGNSHLAQAMDCLRGALMIEINHGPSLLAHTCGLLEFSFERNEPPTLEIRTFLKRAAETSSPIDESLVKGLEILVNEKVKQNRTQNDIEVLTMACSRMLQWNLMNTARKLICLRASEIDRCFAGFSDEWELQSRLLQGWLDSDLESISHAAALFGEVTEARLLEWIFRANAMKDEQHVLTSIFNKQTEKGSFGLLQNSLLKLKLIRRLADLHFLDDPQSSTAEQLYFEALLLQPTAKTWTKLAAHFHAKGDQFFSQNALAEADALHPITFQYS